MEGGRAERGVQSAECRAQSAEHEALSYFTLCFPALSDFSCLGLPCSTFVFLLRCSSALVVFRSALRVPPAETRLTVYRQLLHISSEIILVQSSSAFRCASADL